MQGQEKLRMKSSFVRTIDESRGLQKVLKQDESIVG